jgi:hypothetical protein
MQEGGREKKKKKASPSVFILWKENSTHNLSRDMNDPHACADPHTLSRDLM